MEYEIKEDYTILKIYYKEENKYFDVIIDNEDLEKVKNETIYIFLREGKYRPRIYNGKYHMSLQSFLTPELKISYSKNNNQCDCRKDNITSSPSEVIGLMELKSLKIKEASLKMSKEKRENIARGARENRYTKDYSNKLQVDKLGEKNLSTVLTWKLVKEIRKISIEENMSQYELANIFNVGRATIADIINYRTWTVNPELNERVYKDNNIKTIENINVNIIEFDYNDLNFDNILLKFKDEYLYIEKLSIQGLIYIEQRTLDEKCLASADVYIPVNKSKLMKRFYSIAKMNPKSKGRTYFYNFIDKAFNNINN